MEWIDVAVKIVSILIGAVVTIYVVPWLKEKRLYDTVSKMVAAAQKWNETHPIDKKAWVIEQLRARGIAVNAYVDALIEAAVKELDIALGEHLEGKEAESTGS